MTATKGSDGDLMAVAVFCLEQARQAIRLFKGSPQDLDTRFGLDDLARAEYYVPPSWWFQSALAPKDERYA